MKIIIEQLEDGSYTVTEGGMDAPDAGVGMDPAQGPMLPEEGGQSYQDLESALDAVRAMAGGGESEQPMIEGEEDFVSGFKRVRGIDRGF